MRLATSLSVGAALAAGVPYVVNRLRRHNGKATQSPEAREAYRDMEETLGFAPAFLRAFPENGIGGAWELMKTIQLNPETAIPPKYKELIGLAVAGQIPCRYCAYFHGKTSRLHGATEDEIEHALAEGALTRLWSTYLSGTRMNRERFEQDVQGLTQRIREAGGPQAAPSASIRNAEEARRDMQQVLGFVPDPLEKFPEAGLAGAWREWRAIEMVPGPIPEKYLSLISLGVAAQTPSDYFTYAEGEFVRATGGSEQEIQEAALMAGIVRHWSSYLNGMRYNELKFRRETDRLMISLKKKMRQQQQPRGAEPTYRQPARPAVH